MPAFAIISVNGPSFETVSSIMFETSAEEDTSATTPIARGGALSVSVDLAERLLISETTAEMSPPAEAMSLMQTL